MEIYKKKEEIGNTCTAKINIKRYFVSMLEITSQLYFHYFGFCPAFIVSILKRT